MKRKFNAHLVNKLVMNNFAKFFMLVLLLVFQLSQHLPVYAKQEIYKKTNVGGDFNLTDHNGKRFELKQKASECHFEIATELGDIEQFLFDCSQLEIIELSDQIAQVYKKSLSPLSLEMGNDYMIFFKEAFLTHMKLYYKNIYSLYKRYKKIEKDESARNAYSARLLRAGMGGLSLPLLALTIKVANQ